MNCVNKMRLLNVFYTNTLTFQISTTSDEQIMSFMKANFSENNENFVPILWPVLITNVLIANQVLCKKKVFDKKPQFSQPCAGLMMPALSAEYSSLYHNYSRDQSAAGMLIYIMI